MKKEDTNLWLKKLINTDKFNAWLAVSFLFRYPTIGIHEYICKKLKYTSNVTIVIPQLVHIFLYHSDSEISKPIYNLMKYWSVKSRKFFLSLYFYLKGCIDTLESKKSIQCYFLICDMFKAENKYRKRNTKMLKLQLKFKRRFLKTPRIFKDKKSIPNFDGIFLCFLRSVVWVCDLKLFKIIREYEKIFQQNRNVAKINFTTDLSMGDAFKSEFMKSSIMFIESLVEISYRLKKLPKNLRQKGLEMELKLLNCNLPARITLPFFNMKYILSVHIEYSHILSSAENTPFILVFEIADETKDKNSILDTKNAAFLMQQLNAVTGLTYIADTNNIKDNVLVSIEKILEAERLYTESEVNICVENLNINLKSKIGKINEKFKQRRICIHNSKHEEKETSKEKFFVRNEETFTEKNIPSNSKSYEPFTNYNNLDNNIERPVLVNEIYTNDKDIYTKNKESSSLNVSSVFFAGKKSPNIIQIESIDNSDISQKDYFKYEWENKEKVVKESSKFGSLRGWRLVSMIIKTGCSLKQEIIAYQILSEMKNIWKEEQKDIWIKVYKIYFVNNNSGLVETVQNAHSIHKIKEIGKLENRNFNLKTYFIENFGVDTKEYKNATHNFLISLVGYSIACYLLQIKDRHNGNILLDSQGHIVHVDFGFILGDHPGFYCVEIAPFKFSNEYEELLKDYIEDFKILFYEGFCALRKHSERLCRILEMLSENSDIKYINKRVLNNFKDRLKLEMSDKEIESYVLFLINKSFNSMGTGLYDSYQYFSNGYL